MMGAPAPSWSERVACGPWYRGFASVKAGFAGPEAYGAARAPEASTHEI